MATIQITRKQGDALFLGTDGRLWWVLRLAGSGGLRVDHAVESERLDGSQGVSFDVYNTSTHEFLPITLEGSALDKPAAEECLQRLGK